MDDMIKVKGINVWPETVDDVLFGIEEIEEYQVVVSLDAQEGDIIQARVMPKRGLSDDVRATLENDAERLLRDRVGIRFAIEVVPSGTLAHSEYKARRWIDKRGRNG